MKVLILLTCLLKNGRKKLENLDVYFVCARGRVIHHEARKFVFFGYSFALVRLDVAVPHSTACSTHRFKINVWSIPLVTIKLLLASDLAFASRKLGRYVIILIYIKRMLY